MKSLIFLFLNFLYLFPSLKAFIPNWELRKAGIIINSYPYTYTIEEYSDILIFYTLSRTITKENGEIKYKNKVSVGSSSNPSNSIIKDVNFDSINNYIFQGGEYYICPRGKNHLYEVNSGMEIPPSVEFITNGILDWDFQCFILNKSSKILLFYLINGKYTIYFCNFAQLNSNTNLNMVGGSNSNIFTKININNQLLEVSFDKQILIEGDTSAIFLFAYKENSKFRVRKFTLILSTGSLDITDSDYIELIICLDYSKARFYNDNSYKYLYYITYNDIYNFYCGCIGSRDNFDNLDILDISTNNKVEFQFFEDLEIEEINFFSNSRFFYYKFKIKGTSETKYFGIYDIKLNKVIFNTDEKLNYFLPHSSIPMLAITDSEAF